MLPLYNDHTFNGIGIRKMQTIYTCPAFSVIDLQTDLLVLSTETLRNFNFCVEVKGTRGKRYVKVHPGCVQYYAEEHGLRADAQINGKKHWLNPAGVSITSKGGPSEMWVILKDGQRVQMGDTFLTVKHDRAEFYNLIAAE